MRQERARHRARLQIEYSKYGSSVPLSYNPHRRAHLQ